MRFWLLDSIESFTPDEELVAVKNVSYSEEYLQDHFPEFPVLPGVFMLEAATQAAAWLMRLTDDLADTVIVLREAKNIKYANFVQPGQKLRVTVRQLKKDERFATFKVEGLVDEAATLSGRIVLERYSLADTDPLQESTDQKVRGYLSKVARAIAKPEMLPANVRVV
ncbi:3-hydroxyacyl-ACP dehydratase FabZ family protein [Aeoliella mucimassa]|uniref:3-hydroxyacyl-[acyl-carrier-protein] dehydratase FabZ n=1 Tax=Aeoliella mucimassa TaxID=2527972 RepID=A0A518AGM8_9BACT|nr:3-hydroxyacyl-ACP dehydratase FabZ family protein [Aeoliella mucimassa]QDU53893.1 3-hydroxyacyl-[acyl-carrier-protein] dehydratase FabZ [Aeoliella mucimassa]